MPLDDPSSPGRGVEIDRAIFRVVGRPGLLDEAASALRTFLFHIELISLNSTDSSSFERTKSRMSSERLLSHFPYGIFCRAHLSQKPAFSRDKSDEQIFEKARGVSEDREGQPRSVAYQELRHRSPS